MRLNLSYDQAEQLVLLLDDPIIMERIIEENHLLYQEAVTLTNLIRKAMMAEWHRGNQLTPIHAPFLVSMKDASEVFVAIRKTHCSSYVPETVEVVRQDTGETIVLKASTFDWRHI